MYRMRVLIVTVLLGSGLLSFQSAQAQSARLCFNVPGITNCIEGRFREYWEQNGGLPVFGYPITGATNERTAEGTFLTQYFERNRFELHPEKARPYDVLLGRLGDDRLKQQRRNWQDFGAAKPESGCLFFRETGHNICDLETGVGFKTYWSGHGLQDPKLDAFQRSLALFGLPLSELTVETNAAGDTVITQWFERARFEYHLNNPRQSRVLLGLLGNETRTPPPPGAPLPTPAPDPFPACNGIAAPSNAIAAPSCVEFGEMVSVAVFGFEPNQEISFSVTNQSGATVGRSQTTRVGVNGFATIDIDTKGFLGAELRPGDYNFQAQDTQGRNQTARASFRVIP